MRERTEYSKWSGLAVIPSSLCAFEPTWGLQQRIWDLRRRLELPETLLIVEHEPVITMGKHGREEHLRLPATGTAANSAVFVSPEPPASRIPEVVRIDRGGEVTYHGPGQITAYLILDLRARNMGVRKFITTLEEVVIETLRTFGIESYRRDGLIGIWTAYGGREAKIAAAGVRIERGVSRHGVALNVGDCLGGFEWMVPCGLAGEAVTSMAELLDEPLPIADVKQAMLESYGRVFNIDFRTVSADGIQTDDDIDPLLAKLTQGALRGARKPDWLKRRLPSGDEFATVGRILKNQKLTTVCEEARCPNRQECWDSGTATFMILGDLCSRRCRFCAVGKGKPVASDPDEPRRLAEAATEMKLRHVVVTSVTRDDLPDGGAGQFAAVIAELRAHRAEATIEVLVPDFGGSEADLQVVLDASPDVLNHNVETVLRLYPRVRPYADYQRSLQIIHRAAAAGLRAKSGFMVGLGESDHEIRILLSELKNSGCDHVTIGQYLQPNRACLPVKRYWSPTEFDNWRDYALSLGFGFVDSGALVRSSYHAGAMLENR